MRPASSVSRRALYRKPTNSWLTIRLWRGAGFTDFVSFYLQYTNLYNFVFITQDWDARYLSYFGYTQTIALTVFGIMAGVIMSYTRDVKVSRPARPLLEVEIVKLTTFDVVVGHV